MMCNHDNLLKTKLVEYCKTKDESLFDEKVLDEVINYIKFSCKGWFKYECYTKEDIIEICLHDIGLYIKDYNPDKSDMTTFLYLVCNHAMQRSLRRKNAKSRIQDYNIVYLEEKFNPHNKFSNDKDKTYNDYLGCNDENFDSTFNEYSRYVINACDNLKNEKRRSTGYCNLKEIFVMYYQGYDQELIGKTFNISQVQVSRLLDKIRNETQRLMKKDGIL